MWHNINFTKVEVVYIEVLMNSSFKSVESEIWINSMNRSDIFEWLLNFLPLQNSLSDPPMQCRYRRHGRVYLISWRQTYPTDLSTVHAFITVLQSTGWTVSIQAVPVACCSAKYPLPLRQGHLSETIHERLWAHVNKMCCDRLNWVFKLFHTMVVVSWWKHYSRPIFLH